MFFNVTREKSGRPGRFCDVIITYCHDFCRGSLSPPTRPRSRIHIASYGSLRASKDTVAKALVSRELPIILLRRESGVDAILRHAAKKIV